MNPHTSQPNRWALWYHAPVHLFVPGSIYILTGATLHKQHFFRGSERLAILRDVLFQVCDQRGWELRAWALFSNHYHLITKAPEDNGDLGRLVQHFHSGTAKAVNRLDGSPGRKVWYQYWDRCLSYERSYLARLNYVIQNPVKHGLVPVAEQYPFCSAGWFAAHTTPAQRRKVASFRYDKIAEVANDDFVPLGVRG
jgi:putative transposase